MSRVLVRWLYRRGVSRSRLRRSWMGRRFGKRLLHKQLWVFERKSLARAWLLGVLVAATPVPGIQYVLALPLAIYLRANLYLTAALILSPNPLTAALFYPASFYLGCALLGIHPRQLEWRGLGLLHAGWPLLLGAMVIGIVVGLAGFLGFRCLRRPMFLRPRSVG